MESLTDLREEEYGANVSEPCLENEKQASTRISEIYVTCFYNSPDIRESVQRLDGL